MAADAPTPLPLRPSDADRERVLRLLRDGSVAGRMSLDTHADRVERALGARGQGELDDLVADLRPRGPLRRAVMRAVAGWSLVTADLRSAWEHPHIPTLALPQTTTVPLVLGRARDCDCVIAEPSISRRHARLRRDGERWLLRDLGSRNGTRVNGMRVLEEVEVRPGDRVSFGEALYRLALRR
jgi:hypothetical protein